MIALPLCTATDVSQACRKHVSALKEPIFSFSENAPELQLSGLVEDSKSNETPVEINLPLLFDDIYLGDLSVRIIGLRYWLPWNRLKELIAQSLTTEVMEELENIVVEGYLEGGSVNISLISILYNSELLQIELSPKIGALETEVINFGARPKREKVDYVDPARFSLFINPTISTQYSWSSQNSSQANLRPTGGLDVGGRIGGEKGVAFQSEFSFDLDDDFNIDRDHSQFVYDLNSKLLRISVGDIQPRVDNLQSGSSILGLSIERFFDLAPDRQFTPKFETSFRIDRNSTVKILQNGALLREIDLRPGQYDLHDLALSQGANNFNFIITNDLGEERVFSNQSFFDFDLLEKGVWDYSFNAGFRSNFSRSGISYSDDLLASGYLRRGLSKTLTLGADIQGDETGLNGGMSMLWAMPFGAVKAGTSASQYNFSGLGYSASMALTSRGVLRLSSNIDWSLSFSGRYNSERFQPLPTSEIEISAIPEDSYIGSQNAKFNLNAGFQASKDRWNLTSSLNYLRPFYGVRDAYGLTAGVNYRLSEELNLGIIASHTRNFSRENTGARIRLTWRLNRQSSLNAGYDSIRNESELDYNKTSNNHVGALSYNIRAVNTLNLDSNFVHVAGYYVGNRFEALAQHQVSNVAGQDSLEQTSSATVRSSLAFTDGAFAIGRPIRETYAIIERHPNLSGKKLIIGSDGEDYRASSGSLGPPLVNQFNPYGSTSFQYDVEDLPIGYDLGSGQFHVKPPLNAGYRLQVGSDASYTLIGYVKNRKTGGAAAYLGGHFENLDDKDAKIVMAFTNRNGRLAATGLAPGRYKLTLKTDPIYTHKFTILESDDALVNIGELSVDILGSGS